MVDRGGGDVLQGGNGNDRYVLGVGDHVVIDPVGANTIEFEGLTRASAVLSRSNNDLLIEFPRDTTVVRNHFSQPALAPIVFSRAGQRERIPGGQITNELVQRGQFRSVVTGECLTA